MIDLRGSYDVVVNSRRLQYKFTIRRNVTVIRGQSATGKTTLVDMIRDCNENGIDSGVTISCDRSCIVLAGRNWERFFTEVLQDSTKGTVYQYAKSKLNPVFLHENSKMRILTVMKPLAEILGW